jgi:hypothetical protein
MSRVSEGITRPRLWRIPIERLSMTAAPMRMGAAGRRLLISAIAVSLGSRA